MTSPVAPTETDIYVVQGATFRMLVTWKDNQATPQPISLAGYRAHMQFRPKQGAVGTPLVDVASIGSQPALILEPDDATGAIQVRLPATVTKTLRKNCWYDLFVVNEADETFAVRLVYGVVNVSPSATVDS